MTGNTQTATLRTGHWSTTATALLNHDDETEFHADDDSLYARAIEASTGGEVRQSLELTPEEYERIEAALKAANRATADRMVSGETSDETGFAAQKGRSEILSKLRYGGDETTTGAAAYMEERARNGWGIN